MSLNFYFINTVHQSPS